MPTLRLAVGGRAHTSLQIGLTALVLAFLLVASSSAAEPIKVTAGVFHLGPSESDFDCGDCLSAFFQFSTADGGSLFSVPGFSFSMPNGGNQGLTTGALRSLSMDVTLLPEANVFTPMGVMELVSGTFSFRTPASPISCDITCAAMAGFSMAGTLSMTPFDNPFKPVTLMLAGHGTATGVFCCEGLDIGPGLMEATYIFENAAPTPEPASVALMCLGGVAVLGSIRRRKSKCPPDRGVHVDQVCDGL